MAACVYQNDILDWFLYILSIRSFQTSKSYLLNPFRHQMKFDWKCERVNYVLFDNGRNQQMRRKKSYRWFPFVEIDYINNSLIENTVHSKK